MNVRAIRAIAAKDLMGVRGRTAIWLPISTWRRCRALDGAPGLLPVHRSVGCTPDWDPVAALAEAIRRTGFGVRLAGTPPPHPAGGPGEGSRVLLAALLALGLVPMRVG